MDQLHLISMAFFLTPSSKLVNSSKNSRRGVCRREKESLDLSERILNFAEKGQGLFAWGASKVGLLGRQARNL